MSYICAVETEGNTIGMTRKTWSNMSVPSPIMADVTVTPAVISESLLAL